MFHPTFTPDASVAPAQAIEAEFETHDGTLLFYRKWAANVANARGAVVLLHRGHEHSGRVSHIAEELGLNDFSFYAWDARGHGRSPGERGYSPSFADSIRDLDSFVSHIRKDGGFEMDQIVVIAQSVGAVLASAWVHDYAPQIRALVVASPAFEIKLYVPFAREGIALWQKLKGSFFVNSYVKPGLLTHDSKRVESYAEDPLITRPIASHILLEVHENSKRLVNDARAITVPVLMLVSGSDFVVRAEPQHRFFENLGSWIKERHVLKGFFHDTLGERDRAPVMAIIRNFIESRFAESPHQVDLSQAHLHGFTRDEFETLSTPLSPFSFKGLYWMSNRLSIRLGSWFSHGLGIATKTGFDSGSTLDYVYEDQPRGLGGLGRRIDRQFLDAIGWKGIRQRKVHLIEFIDKALVRLEEQGRTKHVVDIAAGHGRYILDAISRSSVIPTSVRLRDYSEINVDAGRRMIAERGLSERVRFDLGNAFAEDDLAALSPAPDLAVVSGLYELFNDNALVSSSLGGLAQSMQPGSLLIYTNQPWHPQLEMIARALSSHRGGQAWVMRRRTQGEMDQLVENSGFRKLEQRIDRWGIFTVSIAERV